MWKCCFASIWKGGNGERSKFLLTRCREVSSRWESVSWTRTTRVGSRFIFLQIISFTLSAGWFNFFQVGWYRCSVNIEERTRRSLQRPDCTPPPPSTLYESIVNVYSNDETDTSRLRCWQALLSLPDTKPVRTHQFHKSPNPRCILHQGLEPLGKSRKEEERGAHRLQKDVWYNSYQH